MAAFLLVTLLAGSSAPASAASTQPSGTASPDVTSAYGSGDFGQWTVDPFGLPSYQYTADEHSDPQAASPELSARPDSTDAWSQVGNDHVVADAFNHGYLQLWSQDRRYEWTNLYQPASDHFAGGYGYLRVDGRTVSTLYDDRPAGATTVRDFGVGYLHRQTVSAPVDVDEYVYAPFGNDPLVLHDVRIANTSRSTIRVSWFEYWDVNPFDQDTHTSIGLGPATSHGTRLLSVPQLPGNGDSHPLSIFAAALSGPVSSFDTSAPAFFGGAGRATPAAVSSDRLTGTVAPTTPSGTTGSTMFAFRAPLSIPPGRSVTLRYAYGAAHASVIPDLVARYRHVHQPLQASEASWRHWLPKIVLGSSRPWLSRELQWDAYLLRSGATYEECAGNHIVSQGGYYQYSEGLQAAFRDPLQNMLPLIYTDPSLARDVLRYSAEEQSPTGALPYAMTELCQRQEIGVSDDLDVWLLLAASEYGLATRDFSLFDQPVRFADGSTATLWDHLKLAYRHQQSLLGPHGGYLAGPFGDWSDFSTQLLPMTESMLVSAQLAYVYPRLAQLAQARGDRSFARQLLASGTQALTTTRAQWTGRWYDRGYNRSTPIGIGAIFAEPQPWAILSGAPSPQQAQTLVGNIRRFLTGVDAPPQVQGPTRIGSSQSPAANDPDVTERTVPPTGVGGNNAVYVGGSWYTINGWLAWSLSELGNTVPDARSDAFDEFLRNTLAAHATAYPNEWDGILSVDDVCNSFYSPNPALCGNGLDHTYEGQIMGQPTWTLFDAIKFAGVDPTATGYRIAPTLPFPDFSLSLTQVGVDYRSGLARGYVTISHTGDLSMEVQAPTGGSHLTVQANGQPTTYRHEDGLIHFTVRTRAGVPATWSVAAQTR